MYSLLSVDAGMQPASFLVPCLEKNYLKASAYNKVRTDGLLMALRSLLDRMIKWGIICCIRKMECTH